MYSDTSVAYMGCTRIKLNKYRKKSKLTLRDPAFDLGYIARLTAGMSGSDLKEACRDAAMIPMREYIRTSRASGESMRKVDPSQIRGIRTEDFFAKAGANKAGASVAGGKKSKSPSVIKEESSSEYEDVEEGGQLDAAPLD